MHYHVETIALICLIKGLDETRFGWFRPHQLLPETLPLCYWNIDISVTTDLCFTSIYSVPAVTSYLQLINQEASTHHCELLWTWISILKYSNALKASLSANAFHILCSQPTIAFGLQHTVQEIAVLVLVWLYKARVDREQDLWRYWLPECTIKQWYNKPTGDGCLRKNCGLGEEWSIDIAVSHTLAKCSDMQ